jgi:hypothetical protein
MAASIVLWQYYKADTVESELAVGSQQSAVGSQQLAVSSMQSAVGSRQSAVGSQQLAVGSQQLAVGSQKSEVYSSQTLSLNSIVERTVGELRCTEREYKDVLKTVEVSHMIVARASRTSRNNHTEVAHEKFPVVERSRNEPLKNNHQSAITNQQSGTTPDETQIVSIIEPEEIIPEPSNSMVGSPNDVETEQKRTNITYTASDVNARFIKQKVTPEATLEKKNTSGLQKVIDKALLLTNEGTVYGELREKKNEWLSFNNLSDKTETNK